MYGISFALAHEKATTVTLAATRQKLRAGLRDCLAPGQERHQQCPRQQADRKHWNVEVERFAVAVVGVEHAAQMLADEIEVGEARLAYRHRDKPRRRDRKREEQSRHRVKLRNRTAQFAPQRQPNQHRKNRQRRTDRPFGHYRQRHRDVRDPAPAPAFMPVQIERERRDRHQRGQRHVGGEHLRHQRVQRSGGEDRGGEDRVAAAERPQREKVRRDYSGDRGQSHRQPRGEFRDAEDPERQRRQPVEQRRLLDVRDVVEMRHEQVAALQHLARDFGIACLVGLPQSERAKMKHADRERERDDCGEVERVRYRERRRRGAGGRREFVLRGP